MCKCGNVQMINGTQHCSFAHFHTCLPAGVHIRRRRHFHIFTFPHLHICRRRHFHICTIAEGAIPV